MPLILLTA